MRPELAFLRQCRVAAWVAESLLASEIFPKRSLAAWENSRKKKHWFEQIICTAAQITLLSYSK